MVLVVINASERVIANEQRARRALDRAVYLSELYNWTAAAADYAEAEKLFIAAGDERNALHARLGRIRANVEADQKSLPKLSLELEAELDSNPLLQHDKELRMFCLIVKGDIDTEVNTAAMKDDWLEVEKLARELGNAKWQYRALAQLGVAAFYNADLETARTNAGTALALASKHEDAGGQIRILTILANGFAHTKMHEQALPLIEKALAISSQIPDTGYPYTLQAIRIAALIGVNRLEQARQIANEVLTRSRENQRTAHEANALVLTAIIDQAQGNDQGALSLLNTATARAEMSGLPRVVAEAQTRASDIYRKQGRLEEAARSAEKAALATQESGNLWAVPTRLQTVAELLVARRQYAQADRVYDRAGAFIDALIGRASAVLEKTAVIRASSDIFARHFALVADHLSNPTKAYNIIETVRGRVAADLMRSGAVASADAKRTERQISHLRLKLMAARTTNEVRRLRNQIFLAEQSRWVTPGVSILKVRSHEIAGVDRVQAALPDSTVLLEYVVANPTSYCVVISRRSARIVPLKGRTELEVLIAAYVKGLKSRHVQKAEGRQLYTAVLGPIAELAGHRNLVVVRDGPLHLLPFEALIDMSGRYVVQTKMVLYAPSATAFHLLHQQQESAVSRRSTEFLAVGGVPYSQSRLNKQGVARGDSPSGRFGDLPSSIDEVRAAINALGRRRANVLLGTEATEAAFKGAGLDRYPVIHLAVHGFADETIPDRAALAMLSDAAKGEDGLLQASEIVQLRLKAALVVLSACDTAVGALQGQDGVANLSRAFLFAGARNVVSTLWPIEDESSLYIMRRFYIHLAAKKSVPLALATAKRDLIRTFGRDVRPYHWAAFTSEGAFVALP